MTVALNILLFELHQEHAEKILGELRKTGFDPNCVRVESEKDCLAALERRPDLLICDVSPPDCDPLRILPLLHERKIETPLIVVAGSGLEDAASECMRRGAADYLLKDRLARLGPAVTHALQQRRLREERRRAEAKVHHLNRILLAMRAINQLIVREQDATHLLREACRLLVETRGYRMAWVGLLESDQQRVSPAASAGHDTDFLGHVTESWSEGLPAQGPTGMAMRTGKPCLIRHLETDPFFRPWRDEALKRGFKSAVAVPLKCGEERLGALTIYVTEPDGVAEDEVELLEELGGDLAYALQGLTTRRKGRQTEEELARERHLLRTLIDTMPDIIYVKDRQSRFVLGNRGVANLMGAAHPRDLIGKTDFDFYPETMAETFYADEQKIIETETPLVDREEVAEDPSGRQFWILTTKVPFRDRHGKVAGLVGIGRDITARRQTEEALRASESRFRELFNNLRSGVAVFDVQGEGEQFLFADVNAAMETMENIRKANVLGRTVHDVFPSGKGSQLHLALQRGWASATVEHIPPMFCEDAQVAGWREGDAYRLPSGGVVLLWDDVTQRLETERQLREKESELRDSQKMEAVGRLAREVAQDFNNTLTIITGTCELILESMDIDDAVHDRLEDIRDAGERAADLVRQIQSFSQKPSWHPTVLDLNSVIGSMGAIISRFMGERIKVTTRCDPELGRIRGDHKQIEQLIMNLLSHARDAMPDGGSVIVETANLALDEEYAREYPNITPGSYVMLAVSDTGKGIDGDFRSHALEPLFAAVEAGGEDPHGLAAAYGIARTCGGDLWVYSEPGRGTTFKVFLPRLPGGNSLKTSTRSARKVAAGSETVLLVEDEETLRTMAQLFLQSWGYHVLVAANGEEAIRLSESCGTPIHLLLTDVIMPNLTGPELWRRLKPKRPEMKVLFTSGFTEGAVLEQGYIQPGEKFVQKPSSADLLARKVREALDS